MSGNMTPEAAEEYAKFCSPEICENCDKEHPECNREPQSCEGEAEEQYRSERAEARREDARCEA